MTDGLSLSWSRTQAQTRRAQFRQAFGAYLLVYAVAGLVALLAPGVWIDLLNLETSYGLVRIVGALLLLAAALYLPAWQDPLRSKWPNLIGAGARFVLALVWLTAGQGLVWVGVVELVFAVVLAVLIYGCFTAELMSRP